MGILLIYFSGVVLTWVIGILLMKYDKELVTNKNDLDKGLELLVFISIFSWVVVIGYIIAAFIFGIKRFMWNILGDWILKDKEKEDHLRYHG